MRILSYPFRLTANGDIATVEQYSAQCTAEQIAMLILTEQGERQMIPAFGIVDPAFDEVDASEIALQVAIYGPNVSVSDVTAYYPDDATLTVNVEFSDDGI